MVVVGVLGVREGQVELSRESAGISSPLGRAGQVASSSVADDRAAHRR